MGMNLTIDIDYDQADKITIENLKDAHRTFQMDDDKDMCLAVEKIIRYFMTHTEAEEYFNAK